MVVWETLTDTDEDDGDQGIAGRTLAWDGAFLSEETQINSFTTSGQLAPTLAVSPSEGVFLATWFNSAGSSPGNDDQFSVVVGRSGRVGPAEIFSDGFESGDTAAWSSTIP